MQSNIAHTSPSRKIKVLIVDDSITICRFLEATFSEDPDLEVVGYALDPYEARERIRALDPDVLTLEVEHASGWRPESLAGCLGSEGISQVLKIRICREGGLMETGDG